MTISSEKATTFMAAKHWFWSSNGLTDEQVSFKTQSIITLVFLNMRNLHYECDWLFLE